MMNIDKSREFCWKVIELSKEYNLPCFVVTDGASATNNTNCKAVKNARESHIKWELSNGLNPFDKW